MKQEPTAKDNAIIDRAVRKMISAGNEMGISPQNMIDLLNSGMTVPQLFNYLLAKSSGAILES